MRRALAPLALAVAAIAAVLLSGGNGSPSRRAAPPLPAQALLGPRVMLATLRGRPAFVNFFASWCGPCAAEAGSLREFARRHSGRVAVVGVDWADGVAQARRFLSQHDVSYPVLRDASGDAGGRYGLLGLPTTYVLDAGGRIAAVLTGQQTLPRLERALRALGG